MSINSEPVLPVVRSTSVCRGSPCCEVDSVIIYLLKCVDTHLNKLWSTVRVIYTSIFIGLETASDAGGCPRHALDFCPVLCGRLSSGLSWVNSSHIDAANWFFCGLITYELGQCVSETRLKCLYMYLYYGSRK